MRAARLWGERDIRVEEVPDPTITSPSDAIIRVTKSAICGSDIHLYHWKIPGFEEGDIPGHEFTGVIEEVGSAVENLKVGDRVVSSMFAACGRCPDCLLTNHQDCGHFAMFGYGVAMGDIRGGQAEKVRIPFADMTLAVLPDNVSDEQALFLSDILPTGYMAATMGGVRPGSNVAVIGAGPVGLFAIASSVICGAAKVYAIDLLPERLKIAEAYGAIPINGAERDAVEQLWDMNGGLGAEIVIEAVGGQQKTLELALQAVRNRGTVSVVGVFVDEELPVTFGEVFLKGVSIQTGLGMPLRDRDKLLPLIQSGRLDPTKIISHRIPLENAAEAYGMFERRETLKIILEP